MVKDACADEEVHSCMFSEHEAAIAEHHREAIFAKPTGVVDGAKVCVDTPPETDRQQLGKIFGSKYRRGRER